MDAYVCRKPATFAGKKYWPGDTVPGDSVAPGRARALIDMGILSEAQAGGVVESAAETAQEVPMLVGVPLPGDTDEMAAVSAQSVTAALLVMKMNATTAVKAVGAIDDGDTLLILKACDGRKTVITAAQNRADALAAEVK